MNVRIVVADESETIFFDTPHPGAPLTARGKIENQAAHLADTDLETDRAGRRFGEDGQHHGVNGERSTTQHDLRLYAKEVAKAIEAARIRNEFDRLIIMASPKVLGMVRRSLSKATESLLVAKVPKDIVRSGPEAIRRALPRDAFIEPRW